jgi:predicted nucleotidyltransferase
MTTKALLRRLIVTTSVPPFASLYRWIYQAFVQIAVRRLRRFPGLRAIYLRRGLAAGDGVPGVSDIDLAVVGDWDAAWQSRVADSYAWLAHRFPVFDPTLGVYTPESLARLFDIDPFLRHRFAEGRRHWKLLLGEDCLSRLRSLDENQAAVGYEMELRVWWRYFAYISFSGRADLSDRIFVNSLCYKVVAESIRMERGLRGLPVPETREEGIAEALSDGRGDAAEFLDRLEQSARQRHLRYRGEILEDTGSFLVPFIEGCYADLASRLVWQGVARVKVRIDSPEPEQLHSREGILDRLRDVAGAQWARISVVGSTVFGMDEVVVFFEPAPDQIPSARDLRGLAHSCAEKLGHLRSRLTLYLRLPSAALQFHSSDEFRGWQAVLSPLCHPDAFPGCKTARWTESCAAFIRQERLLLADALDDPVIYKANDLDFLRMVWKFLDLVIAGRSAASGEAVFAQTPEAVLRGLRHIGAPEAPFLENFAAAYRRELGGAAAGIGRDVPRAIEYLRMVHDAFGT